MAVSDLPNLQEGWLLDCRGRQHSRCTLATRRMMVNHLIWLLQQRGLRDCGTFDLRQFMVYLQEGHLEPGGRWGKPRLSKKLDENTVRDYHNHIRTFFRWLVLEGILTGLPMDKVNVPGGSPKSIIPFSHE